MRDYEITIKVVLALEPDDDPADAVGAYFAEYGVPEPVSVEEV